MGKVLAIYIAPDSGAPMERIPSVRAVAGVGLEGDRYAVNKGMFQKAGKKPEKIRHVTLIAAEAILAANGGQVETFSREETRRNIVTYEVDLDRLIGKEFRIGTVRMLGTETATPCTQPSILAGKKDPTCFKAQFAGRGGIRAEILSDGEIAIGDPIA